MEPVVRHKRIGEPQKLGVVVRRRTGWHAAFHPLAGHGVVVAAADRWVGEVARFAEVSRRPVVVEVCGVYEPHPLALDGHVVRLGVRPPIAGVRRAVAVVVVSHDGHAVVDDYSFGIRDVEVMPCRVSVELGSGIRGI